MTEKIDLSKYQQFVEAVTSKQSNEFETFAVRVEFGMDVIRNLVLHIEERE